jgi:transcriptional regulator with XRE-family HTH domain
MDRQPDKFSPAQRKAFGRQLRRLREEAGLTQEQLAERCSIHWTHVGLSAVSS